MGKRKVDRQVRNGVGSVSFSEAKKVPEDKLFVLGKSEVIATIE